MAKIYEQHDAAFSSVSAYIIMKDNERVGKVAFKFPRDGAGRLWCYLHILGLPMVRGYAGGYGYDKRSAAFNEAARLQAGVKLSSWQTGDYSKEFEVAKAIVKACDGRDGYDWTTNLTEAGYTVLQAV